MASWTSERSSILSALLDDVVGTPEVVAIRQDGCRIQDCFMSTLNKHNHYFTGSKSEGLDLPGSDFDMMSDRNDWLCIKVIQSLDERSTLSPYSIFLMLTENVDPGFVLLKHVNQTMNNQILFLVSQSMNGSLYLSSDLTVEYYLSHQSMSDMIVTRTRQGPSVETWHEYMDKSESGMDDVLSIHCDFWPTQASEWIQRPRHFGWPTSHDISSIITFGCHLVPVGHPHSDTKLMEWRISFSVAERTLVWSFNHVQMQCYAAMKIILKEFIKVRCSPQNQVLCSYFIKTFLFWKYEASGMNFWRADNFRECIMHLLTEFSECLREGVLRHYFIPRFNLLSVKLTRAAQTELLQLFDTILQSDISVLRQCRTLKNIWSEFLNVVGNKNMVLHDIKRRNMLKNDEYMMTQIMNFDIAITIASQLHDQYDVISALLSLCCKTQLKIFVLIRCLFFIHVWSLIQYDFGNKDAYQSHHYLQTDTFSTDISSSKLWYAILLLKKRDYSSILNVTYEVLSSIPPFVLFDRRDFSQKNNEAKQLYKDMFLDSDIRVMQRARKAWMFNLVFRKHMTDVVPLAIQIELYFSDPDTNNRISLSPLTCTYYLQFLCYHRMCQYDCRNRALQQLIELLADTQRITNETYHSGNVAGHCLLLAGERTQAWEMFNKSYQHTQSHPPHDKYNSALWYLQNCF